jgi:hypothetical protein
MGVRLRECGFRSYSAARQAGKQALEDFLNGLSMEAGSNSFSGGRSRTLKRRKAI